MSLGIGVHYHGNGEMPGFSGLRVKDDLGPALQPLPGCGTRSPCRSDGPARFWLLFLVLRVLYLPALGVEREEGLDFFALETLSGEIRSCCLPL